MPLHLMFGDDFSSYSSQLEFEAAYPYDPPTDMTSSLSGSPNSPYVRWGLTEGPGGVPGLRNATDPMGTHGQFGPVIDKAGFAPECRQFSAGGTWDFAGHVPTEPLNFSNEILTVWSYETGNRSGSFDGNLVFVGRGHLTGDMVVTVTTTAAFGNSGGLNVLYSQTVSGALLESGGIYVIRINGQSSILTEVSPGVWAPSEDGFVTVSINGTVVFSFTGPVWHGENSSSRNWNTVSYVPIGRFTGLQVFDEICETVSPPCECVEPPTVPPALPPPIPRNPPQTPPVIGMQLVCVGGGVVPTQADLVYIENWWGL